MRRKKTNKLFKLLVKCKACGKKFEANHKLRLYCDRCRGAKK